MNLIYSATLILSLFYSSLHAENFQEPVIDQEWLGGLSQHSEDEAIHWIREKLIKEKKELGIWSPQTSLPPIEQKCKGCLQAELKDDIESPFIVFMSFSVPDDVWLSLSKELESIDGLIVLQGLPNNSFKELAEHLIHLKNKGMNATVQLHPQLFNQYEISHVPSFVLREGPSFDKVTGNVSVGYALYVMLEKGETKKAKELKERLK
ncbi:Type IV conjugative transfer system pilus assembly protein TrbC (plasmid) [Candidatus Protochlamydia naegleriophila]|uniref:Type IV conjugative transfer system pilus assembly protein TrbC n=1 Tax=Candidatus Protochlamydia naegleriophila TaxID=389348 RepID=A0A0U5JH41_9BACT|nr:type-F conjugative transfer system pilin assembly protein TrbC [Candidatus Protochlamydia naegleriophila]CUI18202.1 Type IV conjugative transfer system pilus assembly protein TrbC [Candidatus Protochlamydia naegleriophila]